jgi:glutaredoxin
MNIFFKIIVVFLFVLSASWSAFAEMYRWKDKDGNLVVSTNPPPPGVQWEKKETESSGSKAKEGAPAKSDVREVEMKRSNRDIKVVMYMTTWCPVCKKAREYLNSIGVNLIEYDVEKDEEKNKEWLSKADARRGVPVLDIEGTVLQGLNTQAISAVLEERKSTGYQY